MKAYLKRFVISFACLISCQLASAETFHAGQIAEGAPQQLQHWGQMVGQWSTSEEDLKPDGSGWQKSNGADWDFFWAFDGWGIQDNYTSPPQSEAIEDESKRQRGVNLRIYNPKDEQWVLTWLTPGLSKPQNYSATSTEEKIIMLSDEPDAKSNHHRVTFFDITDNSFEWKLEWSKDKEKWLEVYRIHGVKK